MSREDVILGLVRRYMGVSKVELDDLLLSVGDIRLLAWRYSGFGDKLRCVICLSYCGICKDCIYSINRRVYGCSGGISRRSYLGILNAGNVGELEYWYKVRGEHIMKIIERYGIK